jgi:hypothetical protein
MPPRRNGVGVACGGKDAWTVAQKESAVYSRMSARAPPSFLLGWHVCLEMGNQF